MINISIPTIQRLIELAILDGKNVKMYQITELLGYSRNGWVLPFIDATGYTPSQYIAAFRMRCACHNLRTTGMKFWQISESYNVSNSSLARHFRKRMGYTPMSFRELGSIKAELLLVEKFDGYRFTHDFSTCPPSPK